MDQGFPSLRPGHCRTSWAKQYGGFRRGPMPFCLDVTTNGRVWWIKIVVRRRLWRWQIWTRRCRHSASSYRPTFLGSSLRAPWALLKIPPAEMPPCTRERAAAKRSHGVTVVPRRHRRLHLPSRHRRQPTTTTTAWGARWGPASWRCSSARTIASRSPWTTDRTAYGTVTRTTGGRRPASWTDGQEHEVLLRRSPTFNGKEPLKVFSWLGKFVKACDDNDLSEGVGLYVIPNFLAGDAEARFPRNIPGLHIAGG